MVEDTHTVSVEIRCRHFMIYSFRLTAGDIFNAMSYRQDIVYTTLFVSSFAECWLEREIAQWVIDPTIHHTVSVIHGRGCRQDQWRTLCEITSL